MTPLDHLVYGVVETGDIQLAGPLADYLEERSEPSAVRLREWLVLLPELRALYPQLTVPDDRSPAARLGDWLATRPVRRGDGHRVVVPDDYWQYCTLYTYYTAVCCSTSMTLLGMAVLDSAVWTIAQSHLAADLVHAYARVSLASSLHQLGVPASGPGMATSVWVKRLSERGAGDPLRQLASYLPAARECETPSWVYYTAPLLLQTAVAPSTTVMIGNYIDMLAHFDQQAQGRADALTSDW